MDTNDSFSNSKNKKYPGNKTFTDKNKLIFKQIQLIRKENKIKILEEKLNIINNNFELEIIENGLFKYKGKLMKVSTDSNPGKFLKYILENNNHFISDEYCKFEFNCQTPKDITYIIRDLKKDLSKDNLEIKLRRCRDAKGYALENIEFKS